jgi:hypothetical protein
MRLSVCGRENPDQAEKAQEGPWLPRQGNRFLSCNLGRKPYSIAFGEARKRRGGLRLYVALNDWKKCSKDPVQG